ncbi:MAG: chemotaxis protein CheA [Deltaproteobacteria bacterium]|nr:chemotaxis protein CheA [Deltaproteobacteria bacterium]
MSSLKNEEGAGLLDRISVAILTLSSDDMRKLGEILSAFESLKRLAEKEGLGSVAEAARAADAVLTALLFDDGVRARWDEAVRIVSRIAVFCQGACRGEKVDPAALSTLREEIRQSLSIDLGESEESPGGAKAGEDAGPASVPLDQDGDLYKDFVTESIEHLEGIEVKMVDLEADPGDREIINAVFRAFHTIKGVSGFLNLKDVNELSHRTETLLDLARRGDLAVTAAVIDVVFEAIDEIKGMVRDVSARIASGEASRPLKDIRALAARIEAVQEGSGEPPAPSSPPYLGDVLVAQGKATRRDVESAWEKKQESADPRPLGEILIEEKKVSPKGVAQALRVQKAGGAAAEAQDIRVDVQKLDSLVDIVGELVIAQSLVCNDPDVAEIDSQQFYRNISQLGRITSELQKIAMSMRMVPIRNTFQKMSRIVRDLARKSGKEIALALSGEETEIDRNMIEEIHDPLVHMIRNSVDHGIEPPDARKAAGKPECGRVTLRAYHHGGNVVIGVEDDGRGLDPAKILAKARDRGLAGVSSPLTESEVFSLIFEPGFSTAEKITDISGRGVGLDVVRKNVEKLRGTVEVKSSQPGSGSAFYMKLPLTLAIIDGIIVRVGAQRYVMPTNNVVEALRPKREEYFTVEHRGEMIRVRGDLLPLVRLHGLFSVADAVRDPADALAVVVEYEGRKRAILIDELVGKQEVVIKTLGEGMEKMRGISGGAIMGDGRVGLILDVAGIFDLTGRQAACV